MDWKPYPNDRKMKEFQSCVVVVPKEFTDNNIDKLPLFCSVCGFAYSKKEDEKSHQEFLCCSTCADAWAYSNRENWNKGWRPSEQQLEVNLQRRLFKNNNIMFE